METLFRFTMLRDNFRTSAEIDTIDLVTNSQFQRDCRAAPNDTNRLSQLKSLARSFCDSSSFIKDPYKLSSIANYLALLNGIDQLIDETSPMTNGSLVAAIESYFSDTLNTRLNSQTLKTERTRVKDSILAIKLLPEKHHLPIHLLADFLRLIHILTKVDSTTAFPESLEALQNARRAPLKIAPSVLPIFRPKDEAGRVPDIDNKLTDVNKRYQALIKAIAELKSIKALDFINTKQVEAPEKLPPEKFRPLNLFKTDFDIRNARFSALLSPNSPLTHIPSGSTTGSATHNASAFNFMSSENIASTGATLKLSKTSALALMGRSGFTPLVAGHNLMQLSDKTMNRISDSTKAVLKQYNLSLQDPLPQILQTLIKEKSRLAKSGRNIIAPFAHTSYKKVGNVLVTQKKYPINNFFSASPKNLLAFIPNLTLFLQSVPTTHADLRPAGELELMVVKQQLVKYNAVDISHITNVMRGEFLEKTHRVMRETEREYSTETEVTTTTENSLETSDRFEMSRETQDTAKEVLNVKGKLEVSGKLGPQFKYKASGEVSWQKTTESAVKASQKVSREVTEKSSEKITERVLKKERLRITHQIEDTDIHRLNNETGTDHSVGVYQWLSKVYQAQMFNYGLKEVYDLMIPEPGALLMELFNRRRTSSLEIEEVPALDIKPEDLEEDNYQEFVRLYKATDILPPPEPFKTVTYDFNTGGEDKDQEFTNSTRISIPAGYQAYRASVGSVVAVWDDWSVDIVIGQRTHRFMGNGWVLNTALDLETDSIPFAMVTDRVGDVAIAIEVMCESTERALDLWRADTYAKLVQAYQVRVSEQEAKLADLMAEAPLDIESGSEAVNRDMMINEIKRGCISILTKQHFDLFNALNTGAESLPNINFSEALAEGDYVRFFEQAFEWENLTWVTYPYFWGRKSTWENKIFLEDDDQAYQDFLKAGYVRVVLPVREGFGPALDHFRQYGEPWLGGALPTVSDDLYIPIADEIAERLGRPGDEVPVGEPWPVVVPTRLVRLREDASLPEWEQQADGTWAEAAPS